MATEPFAMTLRLPRDLADDLSLIATCDGESVTAAVTSAIADWIVARRSDPQVQEALRRHIDHAHRLLNSEPKP